MSTTPDPIELAYKRQIRSMTPTERVARSAAMFQWTRKQIARQILAQQGPTDTESLKWLVALRLYRNEPAVREMIERKLGHAPVETFQITLAKISTHRSEAFRAYRKPNKARG